MINADNETYFHKDGSAQGDERDSKRQVST